MSLGENIKSLRLSKKLNQSEFSKLIGISRSYLSDLENNRKSPSIETISKISEKLGVSSSYLVMDDSLFEISEKILNKHIKSQKQKNSNTTQEEKAYVYASKHRQAIIQKSLNSYLTSPFLLEKDNESYYLLSSIIDATIFSEYEENVKTNQNLINKVLNSLEDEDDLGSYQVISYLNQFSISNDIAVIPTKIESGVSVELIEELSKIIKDTRNKIEKLRPLFPDNESKEVLRVIAFDKNGDNYWVSEDNKVTREDLKLSKDQISQIYNSLY
ncbi:helix-turn-helix transcriptional regulator [Enterococcus dongliensis]|uniref:helix-turn-helix domain-containing protein n=1 Tax=Enterococcus dongliensis TaxID=2559925 RepID=UPI00288C7596|nr:helix-turn-helix transcriptional regulator [Enterococcus dongliensis]MDT2645780.1 helix-turn-helix transcriptional regulator [Enterococcus dongliensis]